MALPSTIYRAAIELSDIGRTIYRTLNVTVAQHPSETAERLVARLLAYAIRYEEELLFTKGIAAGDEPDLWVLGPDGRVRLWIEVGLPDAERLIKAGRHAERVILFACGGSRSAWERQQLPKLSGIANIEIFILEQHLLTHLAAGLQKSINWSLTITEDTLYLEQNGETIESSLLRQVSP
ncbi:YaeQ family protein [Geobacter sp. SVR]|uniref:YaeQ family protein n=1 Tax=Geobacter sp. SVR TaxID=2495594 RepID=UPI00143EFD2D|nr:YaeQ family protein [Geobacter sp. SVR]BCS56036.1 hypothetical protein GSVR_43440 [Geobacter sp. SVR]GCF84799.1 hypothetical protein GSbR_13990 [Geobacter sp. SVR]